jgi:hypothetical protein
VRVRDPRDQEMHRKVGKGESSRPVGCLPEQTHSAIMIKIETFLKCIFVRMGFSIESSLRTSMEKVLYNTMGTS